MENQLQRIVRESGLETTKAQYILEKFQNYFETAAEWEKKAKSIVVTNETQTAEMEMARVGRLFLREKRIAVEKARKELKEQALREGKAIDGIANVLKALIVPTEKYLEQQEKFVEIREAEKEKQRRLEVERRMEEERIAAEKAEAEERERIRIENERLKAEAIEREKAAEVERSRQADTLAKERAKATAAKRAAEAKIRKEKEAKERAVRLERERAEKARVVAEDAARILRETAEREKRAIEEKAKREQREVEEAARLEREKHLAALAKQKADAEVEKQRLLEQAAQQIECPFCHKKFTPKTEESEAA
jgi:hypothetical protein